LHFRNNNSGPNTGPNNINGGISAGNKYAFEIETYLNNKNIPKTKLTINGKVIGEYGYVPYATNDEELVQPVYTSFGVHSPAIGEISGIIYEKNY